MMLRIALVIVTLFASLSQSSTVYINFDCAFHVRVTFNTSSDWADQYRMMSGDRMAYVLSYTHTGGQVFLTYAVTDLSSARRWNVYLSNSSGTCQNFPGSSYSFATVMDSVFVFTKDEAVKCPDNTYGCHQYCDSEFCVILDTSNRMLKSIVVDYAREITYTYFDDVLSRDFF